MNSREWRGRVLTGLVGAELLKSLAIRANQQAVERSRPMIQSSLDQYEPWMSNARRRSDWGVLSRAHTLVPTVEQLSRMKLLFAEEGPLSTISPGNVRQDIDDTKETWDSFTATANWLCNSLRSLSSDYSIRIDSMLFEIVPIGPAGQSLRPREDGEGLSSQSYRGGIFLRLAEKSDRAKLENVLNFAHELGHQALNLILNSDDVIANDIEEPIYSVIRKTFRPGVMSVHALAAVSYMLELMARFPEFIRTIAPNKWALTRYKGLLEDLELGLAAVRPLKFTSWGTEVILEFEDLLNFAVKKLPEYEND